MYREGLVIQQLRLCVPRAGDTGSIPGKGTKIPPAMARPKNRKKKRSLFGSFKEKKCKQEEAVSFRAYIPF